MTRSRYQPGPAEDHYHNTTGVDETVVEGLPTNWAVDDALNVTVTSPADVTDYEPMLILEALDGETPVSVLEITTSGDTDWYLYDSGNSWRLHDQSTGQTVFSAGQNNLSVFDNAGALMFTVDRAGGGITMPQLPTIDPHVAGQLWNSTGTLKVSAG